MSKQASKNEMVLTELDTKPMSYMVRDEEVKLSGAVVKKYLARGNSTVTEQEIILFMNLCKFQKLNPFLGEAYLVKFGTEAQIVTGKEAFMKRAEECPKYEGLQAGIIVQRGDKQLEIEGTFSLPTDKLLGGWAKVFRSDRKTPYYQSVSLAEYDKKQSVWKEKPSTMIRKVAIVQALREAFPTNLGGLYTEDESQSVKDVEVQVDEEIKEKANMQYIDIEPEEMEKVINKPNVKETPPVEVTKDEGPGY